MWILCGRRGTWGPGGGKSLTCAPPPTPTPIPSDIFPQPDLTDEGLARPVLAGIVATICFLAAAILFSTLAACFVNKQRKRKLKRKKGGCRLENRETGPRGQSCQRTCLDGGRGGWDQNEGGEVGVQDPGWSDF